jgi:hypothetical protein
MRISGFLFARVNGVGRGGLGFSFPWLPCLGRVFGHAFVPLLVCISTPFGMNGVVSGAFSGSFRVVEGFSGSDA